MNGFWVRFEFFLNSVKLQFQGKSGQIIARADGQEYTLISQLQPNKQRHQLIQEKLIFDFCIQHSTNKYILDRFNQLKVVFIEEATKQTLGQCQINLNVYLKKKKQNILEILNGQPNLLIQFSMQCFRLDENDSQKHLSDINIALLQNSNSKGQLKEINEIEEKTITKNYEIDLEQFKQEKSQLEQNIQYLQKMNKQLLYRVQVLENNYNQLTSNNVSPTLSHQTQIQLNQTQKTKQTQENQNERSDVQQLNKGAIDQKIQEKYNKLEQENLTLKNQVSELSNSLKATKNIQENKEVTPDKKIMDKCQKLELQNQTLKNQVQQLSESLQITKASEKNSDELQEMYILLEKRNDTLQSKVTELETQNLKQMLQLQKQEELSQKCQSIEAQNKVLKSRIFELKDGSQQQKINKNDKQTQTLETIQNNQQLEKQIEVLKRKQVEKQEINDDIHDLFKAFKQSQDSVEIEENQKLYQRGYTKDQIQILESQIDQYEQQIQFLQQENRQQKAEFQIYQQETEAKRQMMEKQIKSLENDIRVSKQSLGDVLNLCFQSGEIELIDRINSLLT